VGPEEKRGSRSHSRTRTFLLSEKRLMVPKRYGLLSSSIVLADKLQILASVPDLICVIDAQNGEAIGTPEYRYGLLVIVLGIVASEEWTSTP